MRSSRSNPALGAHAENGDRRPLLVGVLNITPDSFSDGGRFADVQTAIASGLQMVDEGADWLDVGGESTRPGAIPVSVDEEIARVQPVVAGLAERLAGRARISIDTYKAKTAQAALRAGAEIVNDVSGGTMDPEILRVAAAANATVVLGHVRGPLHRMMDDIRFGPDVVAEVVEELSQRVFEARAAGCQKLWVDPGIGFGKRTAENLVLLARLADLRQRVGLPVMVGASRKRFLGDLTGQPADRRQFGTAAAVAAAVMAGADALRVHDVAAMRDVVVVAAAIAAEAV